MKNTNKLLVAIILLAFSFSISKAYAQVVSIEALKILSEDSTNTDSIWVISETSFADGADDCKLDTSFINGMGTKNLMVDAYHYPPSVTSPCFSTDTVLIGLLPIGTYTLVYKAWYRRYMGQNRFDTASIKFTVGGTASIINNTAKQVIGVYPNPAQEQLTLQLPERATIAQVQVIDAKGSSNTLAVQNNTVSVAHLAAGLYVVRIAHASKVYTTRFVKE